MTKKKLLIVSIVVGGLLVFNTIAGILFLVDKYSPKPLGWEYGIEITDVDWSIENWQDGGELRWEHYLVDFEINGKIKNNNKDTAGIRFSIYLLDSQGGLLGGAGLIELTVKSGDTAHFKETTRTMIDSILPITQNEVKSILLTNFIVLRSESTLT